MMCSVITVGVLCHCLSSLTTHTLHYNLAIVSVLDKYHCRCRDCVTAHKADVTHHKLAFIKSTFQKIYTATCLKKRLSTATMTTGAHTHKTHTHLTVPCKYPSKFHHIIILTKSLFHAYHKRWIKLQRYFLCQ